VYAASAFGVTAKPKHRQPDRQFYFAIRIPRPTNETFVDLAQELCRSEDSGEINGVRMENNRSRRRM
jgi:hypothetical protein